MGYKLTGMYIGSQKVRPSGWQPGMNTLAWYPLESNADDYSGNNNNLSVSGTVSYTTAGGVDAIHTTKVQIKKDGNKH